MDKNQKNYQKAKRFLQARPKVYIASSIPQIKYQLPEPVKKSQKKPIQLRHENNIQRIQFKNPIPIKSNNNNQNKRVEKQQEKKKQLEDQDEELLFLIQMKQQQMERQKKNIESKSNFQKSRYVNQDIPTSVFQQKQQPKQNFKSNIQLQRQKLRKKEIRNLFFLQKTDSDYFIAQNQTKYIRASRQQWQNLTTISDKQLYRNLQSRFLLKEFRDNQKAIIKCTLLGNNVFVCMPTGGGKSLNFQLPIVMQCGLTICIMPLLSLIYDQQYQSKKLNIKSYTLTGNTNLNEQNQLLDAIKDIENLPQGIVIFTTPEKILLGANRLKSQLKLLEQKGLFKRIVVDQVHCVSTWGRDFRKQYQNLGKLKQLFPNVPILALTATASQKVKIDVIQKLKIKGCYYFQSSFNRPNLYYQVRAKPRKHQNEILSICKQYKGKSGIIYCSKKKDCQSLCKFLKENSINSAVYHSGINQNQKRNIQDQWMINQIQVIIATIAFGMGINKPDVRFVIHQSISKSIQNYYQQGGRAGRDGNLAECILFYKRTDRFNFNYMNLKNEYSTNETKDFNNRQIIDMIKYAQQKYICRRQIQLNYLGEQFDREKCKKSCDNCRLSRDFEVIQCYQQIKEIIYFMLAIRQSNQVITSNQLIALSRSKNKKIEQKKRFFDKKNIDYRRLQILSSFKQNDLEYLIIQLLGKDILYQKVEEMSSGFTNVYLYCNPNVAKRFLNENQQYHIRIQKKANNHKKNQPVSEESDEDNDSIFDQYKYEKNSKSQKDESNLMNQEEYTDLFQILEINEKEYEKKIQNQKQIQQLLNCLQELQK